MNRTWWTAPILLLLPCCAWPASAAEPPSDLCSLLSPAVVSKTLGSTYGSPKKTVAPRPFPNTNQGTDCAYESIPHTLLFRVYVDPSPSASADLFARLKGFFGGGSTDVSGIGDEAYMDKGHGLHVRKGKVRYYITGSANEKQVQDLGMVVARQL